MKSLIIKLGDDLHYLFKTKCTIDRTTMQNKAMELFNAYVDGRIEINDKKENKDGDDNDNKRNVG